MDDEYLKKGVTGLSRALDSGYDTFTDRSWFAGHTPCAVLAAYYFCRNNPIEPGVDEAIKREVDRIIQKYDALFAPYDDESIESGAEQRSTDDIVHALQGCIGHFMRSGHNVIFAAYALQVLTEKPELRTPPILNGIYKLIEYFREKASQENPCILTAEQQQLTPPYENEDDMLREVFTALHYAPRITDRNRLLFNGHLMTHAHALVMLSRLGYASIARQGYEAHRFHREWSRSTQADNLSSWAKQFTVQDHPFTVAHWNRDLSQFDGEWNFDTHHFKYLYSFYDLFDRIRDPQVKAACELQMAWSH